LPDRVTSRNSNAASATEFQRSGKKVGGTMAPQRLLGIGVASDALTIAHVERELGMLLFFFSVTLESGLRRTYIFLA
jgi:hypothetical protein